MTDNTPGTAEVEAFLATHPETAMFDMMVADMNGITRGKQIGRDYVAKLYGSGVRLPGSNYLLDWCGQNVETMTFGSSDGDPDFLCMAVPGTLKRCPWSERPSAQVLAHMVDDDGVPHFADPRHLLGQIVSRLADLGLKPVVAIEYEFYLIDQALAAEGIIQPAASARSGIRASTVNVYGLDDLYDHDRLLGAIHDACAVQDIQAETIISEYAAGQFEINLHHVDDPVHACDQAILLERAIKQTARMHDAIATFMAKPFAESAGSGLHIHVSLLDEAGTNVLAGEMDDVVGKPISDTLRHAVGGLMATMPEAMAIFAPNANSYRRLKPGNYAPVTGLWGGDNRTLPIRVPGDDAQSIRIEHRVAGADANPYLVMAAVLAGIHHGISNKVAPPAPVSGDGYAQDGVALPLYWPQAIETFEKGEVLPGYFADPWPDCFVKTKTQDLQAHHFTIPQLDYDWYLRTA